MSEKVHIEFEVPIRMRDGITLMAIVYRPEGVGPWPALLTRTPYSKDYTASGGSDDACHDIIRATRDGYIVVIQDCRGRYTSEGEWDTISSLLHEIDDGVDTLNWIAKLPECNGRIGTFGGSYLGYTQWCMLCKGIPSLRTAIPSFTFADPYDGFFYRDGALELGLYVNWALGLHLDTTVKARNGESKIEQLYADITSLPCHLGSLPLNEFGPFIRNEVPRSALDVIRVGYQGVTEKAELSISGKYSNVLASTLNISGWYDIFLKGTIANYSETILHGITEEARQSRLIIGPWTHWNRNERVGDIYFGVTGSSAGVDLGGIQNVWFDHYLKNVDNGAETLPPVKLFIMGENTWRDELEWPLARTKYTPFYLHESGVLNTEKPIYEHSDQFAYDPANPVPTLGGAFLASTYYKDGPQDHSEIEKRQDVLVYTTPALADEIEVTGPVKLFLWAATDARDTDFVARLLDVHPDGRAYNLTDGIIRARYRNYRNLGIISLIESDEPYLYEIDLWATSNLFQKGHAIRLEITSSCFPRWDRNTNSGNEIGVDTENDFLVAKQTIIHDKMHPSHILLPVIPRLRRSV